MKISTADHESGEVLDTVQRMCNSLVFSLAVIGLFLGVVYGHGTPIQQRYFPTYMAGFGGLALGFLCRYYLLQRVKEFAVFQRFAGGESAATANMDTSEATTLAFILRAGAHALSLGFLLLGLVAGEIYSALEGPYIHKQALLLGGGCGLILGLLAGRHARLLANKLVDGIPKTPSSAYGFSLQSLFRVALGIKRVADTILFLSIAMGMVFGYILGSAWDAPKTGMLIAGCLGWLSGYLAVLLLRALEQVLLALGQIESNTRGTPIDSAEVVLDRQLGEAGKELKSHRDLE